MLYFKNKKIYAAFVEGVKCHIKIDKSKGKPVIRLIPVNKKS